MEHWTTGECLALFHAVLKFGENSWEDVSKAICKYSKELHRPLDAVDENNVSRDETFFSSKRCAEKFTELLTQHSTNQEQSNQKLDDSSVTVVIANKLRELRMEELRKSIEARESNMKKLKEEMAEISSGAWDALLDAEIKDTENDNSAVPPPQPTPAETQNTNAEISEPVAAEAPSKKQKIEKSPEKPATQVTEVIPPPTQPVVPTPVQLPPPTPKSPILPPPQPKEEPTPMDIIPIVVSEPEQKPSVPAAPVAPASPVYLPVEPTITEPVIQPDKDNEEDSVSKKKRKASKLKTKKTPKDKTESATATPTPSSPVVITPSSVAPSSPLFIPIKLESTESVKSEEMSPSVEVKKEKPSKHANKGDTVRTLLDTLKKISAHKYAHVFKQPVSLEEAPDYDEIIKQRMDLSTIKKNLIDGKITTTQEFWRDLLLMFQNAMIYNMKGSEIYNMAVKLKKFSAKEMEPIFAAEEKMRIAIQQNQAPGKRTLRSSSSGIPSQKY